MTTPDQDGPLTAPDPATHPLELLREEARHTTPHEVRRSLDALTQAHFALLTPHGWGAGAEDVLRGAIGMERKAQMEMRIGLEGEWDAIPFRKTKALAEMTLPELFAEYRENRALTLTILDLMLETGQRREIHAWTMGEQVPPELHMLSLRLRLTYLGEQIAAQRV